MSLSISKFAEVGDYLCLEDGRESKITAMSDSHLWLSDSNGRKHAFRLSILADPKITVRRVEQSK